MKKTWWKVPVYYVLLGCVCYLLEFQLLVRFGLITTPDGAITPDNTSWLLINASLFLLGLLAAFFLFRRISRRDLLCSAGITVALNVVLGGLSLVNWEINSFFWWMFSFGWETVLTAWDDFVEQLLTAGGLNQILTAVILWLLPLLFALFGKKADAS
ncbi:MAG: hypothetical protein NC541_03295 [bacterium]|nr:hypothetical protein [bacterium]